MIHSETYDLAAYSWDVETSFTAQSNAHTDVGSFGIGYGSCWFTPKCLHMVKKMAPVTHKWIGDQILYGTSFLIFMPFLQIFITFSRQDDDFSNFITCFLFWLWKILDALTSCGEQQLHFCISLPSQKHASPETWRLHCTVNINKKAELIKIVNRLIEGSLFRTFGWGIYLHYSSYGGNNVETTVNSRHWHVRPFSTSI